MRERKQQRRLVKKYSAGLSDLGVSAIQHAAAGIPVYRLVPNESRRLRKAVEEPGTTDLEEVRARWLERPDANIGTSPSESGLVVLDGDRHGAEDGVAALLAMLEVHPEPIQVNSPGGVHAYYALDKSKSVHNYLAEGLHKILAVDVVHNQNVVLPGSVRNGKVYHYDDDEQTLLTNIPPDLPEDILALCEKKHLGNGGEDEVKEVRDAKRFTLTVLDRAVKAVAKAPEGDRNNILNRECWKLARYIPHGYMTEAQIVNKLREASELPDPEFSRTVTGAVLRGMEQPIRLEAKEDEKRPDPTQSAPKSLPSEPPTTSSSQPGESPTPSTSEPSPNGGEEDGPTSDEPPGSDPRPAIMAITGEWPDAEWPPEGRLKHQMLALSDKALGAMVVWALRHVWRYVPEQDTHYAWTGKKWETGRWAHSMFQYYASEVLDPMIKAVGILAGKDVSKLRSLGGKRKGHNSAVQFAKEHSMSVARLSDFDQHPDLLAFNNGVVDLRNKTFTQGHDRELLLTTISDKDFPGWDQNWEELAPTLVTFLRTSVDDPDTELVLKKAVGATMTGYGSRLVKGFVVLKGPANSGKGTVLDIIRNNLGDDYCKSIPMAVLQSSANSGPTSSIAQLPGKRMAYVDDTGDDTRRLKLASDVLKSLSGGGDRLRANEKYKPEFDFVPSCYLWVATNMEVSIPEQSQTAYMDRITYIRFPNRFSTDPRDLSLTGAQPADMGMKRRLREESAGTILWACEGAHLMLNMDNPSFGSSDRIWKDKRAMQENSKGVITMFAEECLCAPAKIPAEKRDEGVDPMSYSSGANRYQLASIDVYEAFRGYIAEIDQGQRIGTTAVGLGRMLAGDVIENSDHLCNGGIDQTRVIHNGRKVRGWKGMAFTPFGREMYQKAISAKGMYNDF